MDISKDGGDESASRLSLGIGETISCLLESAKRRIKTFGRYITTENDEVIGDENGSDDSSSYESELDDSESDEHGGLLSMYYVKRADDLYKNLKVLRIADMALEKHRRNHPNPNFLYAAGGRYNYSAVLNDLYMKQETKNLKKEIKLKLLIERFFSTLDKFVFIANHCLKNTEIGDNNEDFNFALSWIRQAFHWLGLDGAKYYANKSPGPYNGWMADIEFLMNRYFFSPEFNHVNGFDIEESEYGRSRFVENSEGNFTLVYEPYPGYYDFDGNEKRFCSTCTLVLPTRQLLPRDHSDLSE